MSSSTRKCTVSDTTTLCRCILICRSDAMRNLPTSDDDKYHGTYNNKVGISKVLRLFHAHVLWDRFRRHRQPWIWRIYRRHLRAAHSPAAPTMPGRSRLNGLNMGTPVYLRACNVTTVGARSPTPLSLCLRRWKIISTPRLCLARVLRILLNTLRVSLLTACLHLVMALRQSRWIIFPSTLARFPQHLVLVL